LHFKVLRDDLTSLGLRKVPRIQYVLGEWVHGSSKHGLWVARTKSSAFSLKKYFELKYCEPAVVFSCLIGEILFESTYRIETNRVMLIEKLSKRR